MNKTILTALLVLPAVSNAAPMVFEEPNGGPSYWTIPVALIGIIGLMLFIAWTIKKANFISGNDQMKVVSSMSLGQKEKIAIIEVEGEKLLVGITQQNINLLRRYEIKNKVETPVEQPEKQFKTKLAKALAERKENA